MYVCMYKPPRSLHSVHVQKFAFALQGRCHHFLGKCFHSEKAMEKRDIHV